MEGVYMNSKIFIFLYCFLSIGLWKLITFCYEWIYIFINNSELNTQDTSYFVLILSFGITHFFLKNVERDTKIGKFYWWILWVIVYKTIIIPLGYIVIETAFQGVIFLWIIFILGIPLSIILTNVLFGLIKRNRS